MPRRPKVPLISAEPDQELWLLGAAVLWPSAFTLAYFVLLNQSPTGVQQLAYAVGKGIQFLLPILALRRLVGPPWRLGAGSNRCLAIGVSFGGATLATGLWVFERLIPLSVHLRLSEIVPEKLSGFGVSTVEHFALLAAFYSLLHSFLEEAYWRGFVQSLASRHLGRRRALVISSLGFMAHHLILLGTLLGWGSGVTYVLSASVAVGGAVWGWLFDESGGVLAGWLSHALVDAGIFVIAFRIWQSTGVA